MMQRLRQRARHLSERTGFAMKGTRDFARLRLGGRSRLPRIAAVVVGRNDDYMPDFALRLRATVEGNLHHLLREGILVEWNPPPERELLASALTRTFPQVKAYVVAPAIHADLCRHPHLPLLEYHAKNVGLRRAAADWILATNADVALAPDALRTLRRGLQRPDEVWTAQRVDIPWPEGRRQSLRLRDCTRFRRIIPYVELGTGDFLLASRELWQRARGYDESLVRHRIGCDARGAGQLRAHGATLRRAGRVLHLSHPTSCTESIQPHHGDLAPLDGLPYVNPEHWGLAHYRETEIAERIWRIE